MGITYEQLWNKSRMMIERAIQTRDSGDYAGFQLWAAITLELLGKAALSRIHPSLIVDPTDPKGLLVASGYATHLDYRTITAKTLFERLHSLVNVKRFDKATKDFCMNLANLRNAELHSGELPFDGVRLETWLPKFWDTCVMLIEFQDKTLEDFIVPSEAAAAREIIADRTAALRKAVESRIQKCIWQIKRKYGQHVPSVLADQQKFLRSDEEEHVRCPACGAYGTVEGVSVWEGDAEDDPDEPWMQCKTVEYEVEYFECDVCGLVLNTYEEVTLAGLDESFSKTVYVEPRYEAEYGND
jgi:hypothetical protein